MPETGDCYGGPVNSTIDARSLAAGFAAYLLWGLFPLYFHYLQPAGPLEVIVHRAFWGLVFCLAILAATRHLGRLRSLVRQPGVLWRFAVAGVLIAVNWTTYVYAVQTGHTVDAALGYFFNPLVTVALGALVLRERINVLQRVSVAIGGVAVVVLIVGLGRFPWVSLALALSFSLYSLSKKDLAGRAGPVEGMTIETAVLTPVLLGYYGFLIATGQTSLHNYPTDASISLPWHAVLLVGAGVLTMIPLILFARSARGLPLVVIGLLQYITPVMQLTIGVAIFHEPMEPARWAGTALIWLALVFLTWDMYRGLRRQRRLSVAAD